MKHFNTAGPCVPGMHYLLPPESWLPQARELIDRAQSFVVHGPRRAGKTTALAVLARTLTAEGQKVALRVSGDVWSAHRDDDQAVLRELLDQIRGVAGDAELDADLVPPNPWPAAPPEQMLLVGLREWAATCPLPLVLFLDDIEALWGRSLNSVLGQLNRGLTSRPAPFPLVVLCSRHGLRDHHVDGVAGPFEHSIPSLWVGDLTEADVGVLYGQHTAETGQRFTDDAVARAFEYTRGYPWLANALAREVIDEMKVRPAEPISAEHIDTAKPRLIQDQVSHLHRLSSRLHEPRVAPIMAAPLLVFVAYVHRVLGDVAVRDRGTREPASRACIDGGDIEHEVGLGRGRIDLVARWPYSDAAGARAWQHEAVELTVWRAGRNDPLAEELRQLDDYLQRLDLDHGTLVIFDQRPEAPPYVDRGHLSEAKTPTGRTITVLRT